MCGAKRVLTPPSLRRCNFMPLRVRDASRLDFSRAAGAGAAAAAVLCVTAARCVRPDVKQHHHQAADKWKESENIIPDKSNFSTFLSDCARDAGVFNRKFPRLQFPYNHYDSLFQ